MPSKDYFLTRHAQERMKDRGISIGDIEAVLNDADMNHPGPHGDINMIKTIHGRRIKIAFVIENRKKKIITVTVME